jgi:uncharacterized membrane protein YecN with MAPEG domain
MTIPQLSLLSFALWTLGVLTVTIGWYRWSRILNGLAAIHQFRSDDVQGADWYRRAMRAHANCVENLPVFGAIVLVLSFMRAQSPLIDVLSLAVPSARVVQSLMHICFTETRRTVAIRFTAFTVQLLCFLALAGCALARAS